MARHAGEDQCVLTREVCHTCTSERVSASEHHAGIHNLLPSDASARSLFEKKPLSPTNFNVLTSTNHGYIIEQRATRKKEKLVYERKPRRRESDVSVYGRNRCSTHPPLPHNVNVKTPLPATDPMHQDLREADRCHVRSHNSLADYVRKKEEVN